MILVFSHLEIEAVLLVDDVREEAKVDVEVEVMLVEVMLVEVPADDESEGVAPLATCPLVLVEGGMT